MKKLVPGLLALLLLVCSCSSKKSFLGQRYTHFKHGKSAKPTEHKAYAQQTRAAIPATVSEPEVDAVEPVSEEPARPDRLVYTRSAINGVMLPTVSKVTEQASRLLASNSKKPAHQVAKIKPLKLDQKHEKRGLLWGVIDGILAIIVLAIFVALVIWLVLVLL